MVLTPSSRSESLPCYKAARFKIGHTRRKFPIALDSNLPLQRISCAVTLNYNTTDRPDLQVFFAFFCLFFSILTFRSFKRILRQVSVKDAQYHLFPPKNTTPAEHLIRAPRRGVPVTIKKNEKALCGLYCNDFFLCFFA